MQGTIHRAFDKALDWLAFLNGHRLRPAEVRQSAFSAAEFEAVRQIYVR
jgi:hypothetical protein